MEIFIKKHIDVLESFIHDNISKSTYEDDDFIIDFDIVATWSMLEKIIWKSC